MIATTPTTQNVFNESQATTTPAKPRKIVMGANPTHEAIRLLQEMKKTQN